MQTEQALPPESRHLSRFKVLQQTRRKDLEYLQEMFDSGKELSDEDIENIATRFLEAGQPIAVVAEIMGRGESSGKK